MAAYMGAVACTQREEPGQTQKRYCRHEQERLVELIEGDGLPPSIDRPQNQRAQGYADADAELLQHATKTGATTELFGGHIGIRQRVRGHELQGAEQAEKEDVGGDERMRQAGPDLGETSDEGGADHRGHDQHAPETEA